jgi:hemerythrin
MDDNDIKQMQELFKEIGLLLHGRAPHIQGAVLADLLALWLAGHVIRDDRKATKAVRQEMLAMHMRKVRELIPENATAMGLPW